MSNKDIQENFYCAKSKGKVTRVINGIKMVPERKWVGLTDVEIKKLSDDCAGVRDETEFIRAIEAKLKEKNHG